VTLRVKHEGQEIWDKLIQKKYRLVHLSPLVLLMVTCEDVIISVIPSIKVEESIPTFHYQIKYEM
jgi:hypothetical protein